MKILNQITDGVSRGNVSERPFLSGKKINLIWYSIFGILVVSWPLLQRFVTSADQTVGYLDPNIWLLILLSLISFLLVVGLTWLLFQRFWVVLGLPGFSNPLIYGAILLGAVFFSVFLLIESKVKSPMLPLSLFNSISFNVLLLLGAVLNGFYYGTVFILSLYLQDILKYPPLTAGLAFIPLTAGFVISNLLSGNIINRYGIRMPILIGLALFAFGFSGLLTAGMHTSFWQLSVPFLLISLGMGLAVPAMTTGILSSVDKTLSGTGSAALNTVRQVAGAVGVAVFGALAANGAGAILHTIKISVVTAVVCTLVIIALSRKYIKKRAIAG